MYIYVHEESWINSICLLKQNNNSNYFATCTYLFVLFMKELNITSNSLLKLVKGNLLMMQE